MDTNNLYRLGSMPARPIHPGKLIRAKMAELGVTVRDGAKLLGVSRPHLQNLLAGRRAVSAQMAVRLERSFGGTAEDWLAPQIDYDIYHARLEIDASSDEKPGPVADEEPEPAMLRSPMRVSQLR